MNCTEIAQVVQQLDKIEVHGKDNLDRLLGVIQFLENAYIKAQEKEVNTDG